MEQIFMIEVFVKKIVLKVEPPEKDEYELALEAEQRKKEEEAAAAAAALLALKKGKKKREKKKKKKGKKGKEPPPPNEEEMKFMQTCSMQMTSLPLFDFYVAHDNFIAPPPPEPVGKKGKKGKKKKPKKKKKGKKGKKPPPFKIVLPSDPLPQPPYFGVGNSVVFLSRPSKLEEHFQKTPINVTVWNRNEDFQCTGFVNIDWNQEFIDCLKRSAQLNPVDLDCALFRNTKKPEMISVTLEMTRHLQCEEDLKPAGQIDFYIRLSCLGNRVLSHFVALPEMERIPGRKYLQDDNKIRDLEVVRHWEGTLIESVPPVPYFFSAPDIMREPIIPVEPIKIYEEFVAPFTQDELAILSMGFPKGPCGGTNCPKRLDFRGSQHQFIFGEKVKGKYQHGSFVNKRDVHGPCGRLDCPLAKRIRNFINKEGGYKPCDIPCMPEHY